MSRESNDRYDKGRLIAGYDYINQAWVQHGNYEDCGHPQSMRCDCFGRKHKGEKPPAGGRWGVPNGHHPDCDASGVSVYNVLCSELCPLKALEHAHAV